MRVVAAALAALIALTMAACGSGETTTVVQTVTVEAGTATTATTTTTTEPVDDEPEEDETDCDALGINPQEMNEGICESNGVDYKVVNRDTTLKLPEVAVTLDTIGTTDVIEREYDSPLTGSFVVAQVSVTNRLNAPVTVDGTEMFGLGLGEKVYSPDFDAMNNGGNPLVYEEIQPGQTAQGRLVFQVRPRQAAELDKSGNLNVIQFSDVDTFDTPKKRVGIIRTYN